MTTTALDLSPSPPAPGAIGELHFDDRFVRELPGERVDGDRDPRVSRPVADACHSPALPTPVPSPRLLVLVPEVARLLDLSTEDDPMLAEVLGGNRILPGMAPYAACYGGHQFGSWAGQLGDGRAITLGEVVNARGEHWEVQLKGAGPTAYSRRADGRAVLRSSIRELVCSEAMHHLGVPTTRALSLVTTGSKIVRDMLYDGHPREEPGAIVCRVAPSFLRFGNFEIHAARGDHETLRRLVDFSLRHFFPGLAPATPTSVGAMFERICRTTAHLVVEWMRVGFVHGVMNTDNMSILGLTIDYGPYGWLDVFDPGWTPNITDASGRRYRFGNQPGVARWNLIQLANALLPLVGDPEPLEQGIAAFTELFAAGQKEMLFKKLGLDARSSLASTSSDEDDSLIASLLRTLTTHETDMTLFFRRLAELPLAADLTPSARFAVVEGAFYAGAGAVTAAPAVASMGDWLTRYAARAREEERTLDDAPEGHLARRCSRMNAVNPIYVPRNYLVQLAIDGAEAGDAAPLHKLMDVLRHPYEERADCQVYAGRRPEWARHRAGCSMLSCSS